MATAKKAVTPSASSTGPGPVRGPASYFPSIEKKYGSTIAEWQRLIRSSPLKGHMELVNWLKTEHGMGHGHANALVAHSLASKDPS